MSGKPKLIWDTWNKEHIRKYSVTVTEAEEAYVSEFGRSNSYKKRQAIYGKTKAGRLITIAVSYEQQPDPYVVSVRDMSKKERRDYYEKN